LVAIMLIPIIFKGGISFSFNSWKRMIVYALPLLVAGFAGILNEALDKILLKYLLPAESAMAGLGIYGACYRVSVLMILFIQAFRFAAEPFFFAESKNENAKELYARVMKVFVVTCLFIFLGIMLFMDVIQYFIGKDFRGGLDVVPILLIAHIFLGIYFNLSIWYKLTGQTRFGAYIAVIGAAITILINVFFIPVYGYYASAWAHLICYLSMTVISWWLSRKHYFVKYDTSRILLFFLAAFLLFFVHTLIPVFFKPLNMIISFLLLLVFGVLVWIIDEELRQIVKPLVRKIFTR